jgi:hypothetical protein
MLLKIPAPFHPETWLHNLLLSDQSGGFQNVSGRSIVIQRVQK